MKTRSPYFVFSDPKREKQLQAQRWFAVYPFDDHRHYGIQNRQTKVVIVRDINFVEALTLLDVIMEGEKTGR